MKTTTHFLGENWCLLDGCPPSGSKWHLLHVLLSQATASSSWRGQAEFCGDDWQLVQRLSTHTQFKCHLFCEALPFLFLPFTSCPGRPGAMSHFLWSLAAPCPFLCLGNREISGWFHLVSPKHKPMKLDHLSLNDSEPEGIKKVVCAR